MDTRWLKQNRLLLAFGIAFIVVLTFVGVRLWGRYKSYQETQATLEEKLAQLEQLQNNDPTPTPENAKVAEENVKELQAAQRELFRLSVRSTRLPTETFSNNIEFTEHLRQTIKHLDNEAGKAGVVIPKDFKFGFKRYATSVPKAHPRLLERLGKQLLAVQKLTILMIQSGAKQIDAIRRVELEPGPPGEDTLADNTLAGLQEHFIKMPFEIQFIADSKALQTFLNNLTAADIFFAIQMVGLEQEVLAKPTVSPETPSGEEPPSPAAEETVPTPPHPSRLRVKIRLNFIEIIPLKLPGAVAP